MTVPPQVKKALDYVDALSIRERAMVAVTLLAIIWAVWDTVLMQPLRALEQARTEQVSSLTGQLAELNVSIQRLAAGERGDAELDARRRLAEMRAGNIELDRELREALRELVEPDEMAALLEAMLVQTGNLAMVRMITLPARPITVEDQETGYFRHGLSMQVRGSYLDALRYLQALERLQWKFLWSSVDIEVVDHPTSTVTIVVHTLGRRPGAIGV
jgi:MSHA biogenesis protein MshJ